MNLTQRGIFLFSEGMSAGELAAAARHIEQLGYGAVWFPEAVGREPMLASSIVLQNTSRLIAATGIVNIYSRDPMACAMMQQTLTEQSDGRFLLGLGVSHTLFVNLRGHDYGKPLATMKTYVDNIVACHKMIAIKTNLAVEGMSEQPLTRDEDKIMHAAVGAMPLILAALGPKMTALSAQIAQGSHPANTTPEHTARAREILGRGPWLAPMLRVCLSRDASVARRVGRQLLALYLGLPNYLNMWRDYGYSDTDFANGGSDRLVDAMLAWGDEKAIERRIQEHLDAGATHVPIVPVNAANPALPCWRAIEAFAP